VLVGGGAAVAGRQRQQGRRREHHGAITQFHQRVVELAPLIDDEAVPLGGVADEELEPVVVSVLEPLLVDPVPVAPIDDVPPAPVVPPLAVVSLLPDMEPLPLAPAVVDGVVELVLPVVVDDVPVPLAPVVVPVPGLLHAPSERAATTQRAAAVAWVSVFFMEYSLGFRMDIGRAAATALRRL
jgi:hypothetical protein